MRLLAFLLVAASAAPALAGDGCCAHCGNAAPCRKVCRLVCEDTKVETTCWGLKTEQFCMPGPSEPGCEHCETVCQDCVSHDPSKPYAEPKRFLWREWRPGGAKVFTKTKLMKKTVTVKVPTHKWVIEDLCAGCEAQAGSTPTKAATADDNSSSRRE